MASLIPRRRSSAAAIIVLLAAGGCASPPVSEAAATGSLGIDVPASAGAAASDVAVQADGGTPWLGEYPAAFGWSQPPNGTVDILDPYTPFEVGVADANKRLHAQIEFHERGWELSVEVDLISCGFADCYCPCR